MRDPEKPSNAGRNALVVIVLLLVAAGVVALLRGGPPQITARSWPAAVGRQARLDLAVHADMGVRAVRVFYRQQGRVIDVARAGFPGRHFYFAPSAQREIHLSPVIGRQQVKGLADGPAELVVQARAGNLLGSTVEMSHAVTIRSVPPRIEVLSTRQYVHQGGAEMVVYRVVEPGAAGAPSGVASGVEMAGNLYPGYPVPGAAPGVMFCLFAFPYNAPAGSMPRLVARDDAGNQAAADFPASLFATKFRTRTFAIDDAFIARVVGPIIANTPALTDPGTPLQQFLLVNRDLRRTDARELAEASGQSVHRFLWHGAFLALAHATVEADFADHRLYKYDGKIVDQEDHLGYDLAVVRHTPVLAANDGRVLWAHYFGIYGNAILIDHGFGLMSLYAHLNDFAVKPGDVVKRGQLIAHSDSTGLAGGDHLHFSMLLDGVQVNPMEWWDPHWVHDRIESKLAAVGANPVP